MPGYCVYRVPAKLKKKYADKAVEVICMLNSLCYNNKEVTTIL
jgi:hypothetical protein